MENKEKNELGCIECEYNKDADDLDDQEEEDDDGNQYFKSLIICFSS